jgi:hypothetical protein
VVVVVVVGGLLVGGGPLRGGDVVVTGVEGRPLGGAVGTAVASSAGQP